MDNTNGTLYTSGGATIRSTAEINKSIKEHLGKPKPVYSSGVEPLDQALNGGFRVGLYIIGAVPGIGKTDIAKQISDGIAKQGHCVLYFSLEMSDIDLSLRSLSRYMALLGDSDKLKDAKSDTDIEYRYNDFKDEDISLLDESFNNFEHDTDGKLYIVSGMMDITIEELRTTVEKFTDIKKQTPVVIVDYMQILAPSNSSGDVRQNIDHSIKALKKLSRDFDTPVISISAFNRASTIRFK